MFFRKKRKDNLSQIFSNGSILEAGPGGKARDVDPLAVLRSQGIDTDLIPDSLLPTIASSFAMNTDESNENAKIKVDCESCKRPVAYGRGKCMYCGKPLELPFSVRGPDVALEGSATASESDNPALSTGIDFNLGDPL